ncbi:DUF6445 family protein [Pseudoalteromonas neustonica]|uniref:DUF6445 family protein n=1 Tax=Pseudoalteromonas neustonica TaxID=1840331 RepID=UPI0007DAFD93|nr:DUF6445 family protein [Pseudoalteromonas neustonica]
MRDLKLNPKMSIEKKLIPGTTLCVYIIDDFLLDAASVINFAYNIAYFNPMFSDNSYYPGKRDNMPQPYLDLLQTFFQNTMLPVLELGNDYSATVHKCLLSLITCEPSSLLLEQKIPHIDSCDGDDYAFVHYLSPAELGGTSIYKYTPENLIQFSEEHRYLLEHMMPKVENSQEEHHGYINSTTSLFEQVLTIKAKFNRLVIYQGNLLHSANITCTKSYSNNPKQGRLSIASFASIKSN